MKPFPRNNQYRDTDDIDKAFPDPPFNQSMFDEMNTEVKELEAIKVDRGKQTPTTRERWILKHGGATWSEAYGLAVTREYGRLTKKWSDFTEWQAKRDFASGMTHRWFEDLRKQRIEKKTNY